jgi:hypothetical protein
MTTDATTLFGEELISLYQAARQLPPSRRDRPVTFSCVLRWITKGAKGPNGQLVRLEGIRLGGRWLTSREALIRFSEALTPRLDGAAKSPTPRTARQRSVGHQRAERNLDQLGM